MALANIPGAGAYYQRRQMIEQEPMQQLQQVQGAMGLMEKLRQRDQDESFRLAMAESGGDVEQALKLALSKGDVNAAAKLTPLVKLQQEQRQAEETRKGLATLLQPQEAAPQNPMVPGPGASVMAGSGSTVPQSAPQPNPETAREQRRAHLNKLSLVYANNPTMQSRILAEIGKLDEEAKPAPLSPLGKLIAERDKYQVGSKERETYDQAITKFQPGGVQVNVHPNAPLIPGKPAQNKIDEGLLDAGVRQQRLLTIERQFRPEFQQYVPRISAGWSSLKEKMGVDLSPEDKTFLTDFSAYKRNSINSMNEYIKSITGAAMSEAEAERILRGMPNPGQGLFDGDSPTEFKAKMDDAIKQTRLAEARLVYIKRNGMSIGDVSLERMPSLMNQRGGELEKLIRQQNGKLSDGDVRKLVKRNLAQEFGLVE